MQNRHFYNLALIGCLNHLCARTLEKIPHPNRLLNIKLRNSILRHFSVYVLVVSLHISGY